MALSDKRFPCGSFWGHNGDWLGFNRNAFSSKDGRRQFVLFVNADEEDFLPDLKGAIFALGRRALCG